MTRPQVDLQSERLRLVAMTREMCVAVARGEWPSQGTGSGRSPRTPSELVRDAGTGVLRHDGRDGSPAWTGWLIFDRSWPEPHGVVVLMDEVKRGGIVEIGWALERDAEGHGYASEAVGAISMWACQHRGVALITAHIRIDNPASSVVAQRVGFVCAGRTRDREGETVDRWEFTTSPK